MKTVLKSLAHPALRPVLMGVVGFMLLNALFTAGVTFSPLNQRFNFKYGNFLPAKLQMLKANAQAAPDVLFLGTSQTNNGFIPSVFEKAFDQPVQSFNLGLPNNRYDIMLSYLRFHQQSFGKPKLLLVELSPSIQEKDAYQYYLPALYYRTLIEQSPTLATDYMGNPLLSQNVKDELVASSFSVLHQYRYTFSPVNIVGKVSQKVMDRLGVQGESVNASASLRQESEPTETPTEITDDMLAKGWYPKAQSRNMTTPEGIRDSVAEARNYYIDQQKEVNTEKLNALLAYCRKENIRVVLVAWPNHPAFLEAFRQSPLSKQYQESLQAILAENPVPVVDLNQALPRTNQHALFADPRHLTPKGARLFSEILADRLSALL